MSTQESYHKSKPDPSSSDSFEYKGLLGPHVYQILDAYSKEGVKYLLLRNPHARHVRVYTKNPDDSLSAHAARQISSGFWSQDSYDKQQHPTLSYQQFRGYSDAGGVFEIEFNDLNKHQCEVTISPAPSIEDDRSFKYD